MAIYVFEGFWVSEGEVVRLDPDDGPKSLMGVMDCLVTAIGPVVTQSPEV
jgi:hypothetical protein